MVVQKLHSICNLLQKNHFCWLNHHFALDQWLTTNLAGTPASDPLHPANPPTNASHLSSRSSQPGVCWARVVLKFATRPESGGARASLVPPRAPSAPGGGPGGVSPRCSCGMGARISVELIGATPGPHFLGRDGGAR